MLGQVPLAVSQAAAHMNRNQRSQISDGSVKSTFGTQSSYYPHLWKFDPLESVLLEEEMQLPHRGPLLGSRFVEEPAEVIAGVPVPVRGVTTVGGEGFLQPAREVVGRQGSLGTGPEGV
jgi:hypothetical protein